MVRLTNIFILTDNSELSQKTVKFWINEAQKAKLHPKYIRKAEKILKYMKRNDLKNYSIDLGTLMEDAVKEKIENLNKDFLLLPKNP